MRLKFAALLGHLLLFPTKSISLLAKNLHHRHLSSSHQKRSVVSVIRTYSTMKRKATDAKTGPKAKRQKEPEADYCDVITRKDESGDTVWPASMEAVENARSFLREW